MSAFEERGLAVWGKVAAIESARVPVFGGLQHLNNYAEQMLDVVNISNVKATEVTSEIT